MKTISIAIATAFFLLTGNAFCANATVGVTDTTILLGQTVGITGTVAGPAREMNEGANAYFSATNKKGGVHGRKIELITLDDKFDPALTRANAETLIVNNRVFALFQGRGTPHTQAVLPLLETHGIPLIAPTTGATIFHEPVSRWLFNVKARYHDEIAKAVEHFDTVGVKRIGMLHVDDSFGQDCLTGFNKTMAARELTPAIVTRFERVKPNYASAVAAVIKANPQALIIASSSRNTIEVIKAFRAAGSHIQMMTLSNNSSASFLNELGAKGKGVIVSQTAPAPHLISTELGQEFTVAAKATGATVSYAAMEGYVNAKVLVEGLRHAGRNLTREGLVRALESMRRVDMGGVMISYGEGDHTGSEFVELTMIGNDGRFIR